MYKDKIIKALAIVKNIDDIDYLEQKIISTSQINRRTVAGRALTDELLAMTNAKAQEFMGKELPF